MSIASRLSNWCRRRKNRELHEDSYRERREFVYLDEVSVLSILASRTGRIATASTENQTSSQSSEVHGSLGVGLGGTKANLGTKMQTSQIEASQVSRQAIIQSSFKDLYDIERSVSCCVLSAWIVCLRLTCPVVLKGCLVRLRGLAYWSIQAHSIEANFWKWR